jgi:hypothetical protein
MPPERLFLEYDQDHPPPHWPGAKPGDCVRALRLRCRMCQHPYEIHFARADYEQWAKQHLENWAYVYLQDEAGWDLKNGVCGECIYAIQSVQGRLN